LRPASLIRQSASHRIRYLLVVVGIGILSLGLPQLARAAALSIDASVKTHQSSPSTSITSGAISTSNAKDLLVAFLTSDGPGTGGSQSFSSVAGGGMAWTLRQRTNAQPGTAEIWAAVASNPLTNVTVTANRSSGAYVGSMTVVAFSGADTTTAGAMGSGNGPSGAPSASLTTTRAGSWVWGVGDDYDQALGRTVGGGQTLFDQYLAGVGDTYWVQSQTAPGKPASSPVTA
jgi:hypothetical protein